MASKQTMKRTVGLLLPALLMTAFGTLKVIPDDKVFTDNQKTLINGTLGILTCRFTGLPYAVYWKKGHDPFTAPTLMTWTRDGKTGPRYEDGTCDMDGNYSLIIKTVNYTDAGRYICLVSNQHGVLIDNYTDVTVTDIALETKPTVSTQISQTGVLPCHVNIRPKKVSWIRSPDITLITIDLVRNVIERRPGYEEGLFNMTKEYSLVINDVTIQHEGRYICEVIDFDTDKVYRDVTLLSVFAQPTSPFPTIEGCPLEDQSNCLITTDSSNTLTCLVNEYYPDINLFFMHGSKRVESIDTKTFNNTDGTRNKSITISADKSRDAYKCIASGIPGLGPNDEIPASVRLIQEQRISLILTAIFVLIVICLTGVLLTWMKLRKRGKRLSKEDEYIMEDHISFAELWQLAEFITDLERDKLVSLIISLNGNEELPTNMNQDYYYQELCRWKDANVQRVNQRTALYEKFSKVGVDEVLKQLEGFRKDILAEVPTYDFEHILWQIAEPQKIAHFLENLGVKIPTEKIPMERKLTEMKLTERKSFIQEAVDHLVSWTNANLTYNPVVVLSSTLEQMGMCTADDNFFQLPNEEKGEVQDKDVKRTMRVLTRNHCEKLEKIIKASGARLEIMSAKIAEENNEVLFNTKKMLSDWVENVACSNYDKRRKLENVLLQKGSKDIKSTVSSYKGSDPWISDDELKIISRYLDSTSMASLCEKLCISTLPEDADEKGRFETLCAWRESVSESEWGSMYGHLRNALGEVGILGRNIVSYWSVILYSYPDLDGVERVLEG